MTNERKARKNCSNLHELKCWLWREIDLKPNREKRRARTAKPRQVGSLSLLFLGPNQMANARRPREKIRMPESEARQQQHERLQTRQAVNVGHQNALLSIFITLPKIISSLPLRSPLCLLRLYLYRHMDLSLWACLFFPGFKPGSEPLCICTPAGTDAQVERLVCGL